MTLNQAISLIQLAVLVPVDRLLVVSFMLILLEVLLIRGSGKRTTRCIQIALLISFLTTLQLLLVQHTISLPAILIVLLPGNCLPILTVTERIIQRRGGYGY